MPPAGDFRRQRAAGIAFIGVGAVASVVLWLAVDRLTPPLAGMASLAARMVFTLKCLCAAILFSLVLGVEAVAHERLTSPAFDPSSGFATRRLELNQRYLQNTLEQSVVFAAGLFGLAAYSPSRAAMRAVGASAVVWTLARWAFWLGYHRSAAMRGLGASGMALGMILLIYVASRFGGEVAGPAGAVAPVALFVAIEAGLFWTTRPRAS